MKRILILLMLTLAGLSGWSQVGAPNKNYVRIMIYVAGDQGASPIRYTITITPSNGGGGRRMTINSTAQEQVIDASYFTSVDIGDISFTVKESLSCINTESINVNYRSRVGKYMMFNCTPAEPNKLAIDCFVVPVLMIDDPNRVDPSKNTYCDNQPFSLNVTYDGVDPAANSPTLEVSYDGLNFTPIGTFTGASYTNTARNLFGAGNHLGQTVYLRATNYPIEYDMLGSISPLDEPWMNKGPNDGSNVVPFVFLPSTPLPISVQPVQPLCAGGSSSALNIQFERSLYSGEQFTAFTLFQDDGAGNKILFDQYANPPGLDASNRFSWNGTKPMAPGRYYLNVEGVMNGLTECNNNDYVFDVVAPLPVTFTSAAQHINCFGGTNGSISIAPSGGAGNNDPALYQYSNDNGASWQPSSLFSNLPAGTYTLLVKDGNNCVAGAAQQVTINAPLSPITSGIAGYSDPTAAGANNGSISLSVSGGTAPYSFQWNNGSTAQNISGLAGGTYTCTITDSKGCTAQQSLTLVEPDPIRISFQAGPISCYGASDGSLQATVTGGTGPYALLWNNGKTTASISQLSAGTYTLTVTDDLNNRQTASYTLQQPAMLTVQLQVTNPSCFAGSNGAISSTAAGGTTPYRYDWSNGTSTDGISGLAEGSYDLLLTDARGCYASAQATVTAPAQLVASGTVTAPSQNGAADGTIRTTLQGGTAPYNYQWSNGQTSADAQNIPAGDYTVLVTDSKGCSVQQAFTVQQPDPLVVSINRLSPVLCYGSSEGNLEAVITGGVTPYRINWSNGSTTAAINNLSAATYTVTVTDANGLTRSAAFTLTQPAALQLQLTATEVSCGGTQDGSVTSQSGGGTAPYQYLWNTGQATPDINNIGSGGYNLQLTDNNGCVINASATVYAPNALALNAQVAQPVCTNDRNGSVQLQPTGGRQPYQVAWTTGTSGNNISSLGAGTYGVSLTDNSGCLVQQSFVLKDPPPIVLELGADKTLCLGQSYTADASIPNGSTYQWQGSTGFSANTPKVQLMQAGRYTVSATDNKGCSAKDSITLFNSYQLIRAEFLLSTQAYQNETVVIANISNPALEEVLWDLPQQATVLSKNASFAEIAFRDTGLYSIRMTGTRGACSDVMEKSVLVMQRTALPEINTEHKSLFAKVVLRPNPSNGLFMLDITATENATVQYRVISANVTYHMRRGTVSKNTKVTETFNLTGLTPGAYMLLIESSKENKVIKLIIL